MLKQTYRGFVTTGEWKTPALHDPTGGVPAGPRPVAGVGRLEPAGASSRSRRQDAALQVVVQVHPAQPPHPVGWADVPAPVTALSPSRRAQFYGLPGHQAPGRLRLEGIESSSDRVWTRAAANGSDAEDAAQERWLILLWPHRSPFLNPSWFWSSSLGRGGVVRSLAGRQGHEVRADACDRVKEWWFTVVEVGRSSGCLRITVHRTAAHLGIGEGLSTVAEPAGRTRACRSVDADRPESVPGGEGVLRVRWPLPCRGCPRSARTGPGGLCDDGGEPRGGTPNAPATTATASASSAAGPAAPAQAPVPVGASATAGGAGDDAAVGGAIVMDSVQLPAWTEATRSGFVGAVRSAVPGAGVSDEQIVALGAATCWNIASGLGDEAIGQDVGARAAGWGAGTVTTAQSAAVLAAVRTAGC